MARWVRAFGRVSRAVLVLGAVVAGLLGGLTVAAVPASAQQIVVEGNRRVEASTIQSYFRLAPGERLDEFKIDAAYKALIATGLFQDVRITRAGGRIIVHVVEAPVINRIQFEGNRRVKDEQLNAEIQSRPRGTLSRAVVQSDVLRIVEIYRAVGRYDVRVEPKIIELPNNRVDLVFEITEGAKTVVKEIRFVGANSFSRRRLLDTIKTQESGILTIFKSSDLYDPDRIEADRELLRRFYLSNGFADVRIVSAAAEYDPSRNGFVITFTIEEGPVYRFGTVDVISNVSDVDPAALRGRLRVASGDIYNAALVEKTVEEMTIELAKRGYAFAQVRPRGDRDFERHLIHITFVVEQGPRAYVERINIRGNTRTRDWVIRREFDLAEGDAFNRVLIDRAERRLKNLNYFKSVRITTEPGSAPDRVVVNVFVEEQATGQFSIAGGYSTADGFIGEVSIVETNLLGLGHYAKVAASIGSYSRGFELSFADPYFLDYRLLAGVDVFWKETRRNNYISYNSSLYGAGFRFGAPLREDLSLQLRYTLYRQEITLPPEFTNCDTGAPNCFADGEASVALKQAVLGGPVTLSVASYGLTYSTLDNNRSPRNGLYGELRQDVAGLGGDVNLLKTTTDWRWYNEIYSDVVGLLRVQAGHITAWGGKDLRMLDHFFLGPTLVRGFQPQGIGPRDLASPNLDALGGTLYWGATAELQFGLWPLPKDVGMRFAVFADAGSLWNYKGPSGVIPGFPNQQVLVGGNGMNVRASVGAGIIWDSPFGPLRLDYAYAVAHEPWCFPGITVACDKQQSIRFSGGTRF